MTRGKYIDAKKSTDEFTRKLKIKFAFHNTDFEDTSLCRNKSDKSINVKDGEMIEIIRKIQNIEPEGAKTEDNLTHEERNALKELQNENNVVIKEADKGDALVIMDRDFYENKLVITFMMLQHT